MIEAIARGVRQLQELQERSLQGNAGGASPGGTESVKPGLQSLLSLASPGAKDSPLIFQDWIEVISTGMKDLSDNSGAWWEAVLRTVEESYARWLGATQLERLSIKPEGAEYAVTGRWARVNARACQLLLNAVPEGVRSDLIARRATQDVTQMVFRLFVTYQPGGSSERGHTLMQLQSPATGNTIQETLEILRSWPRHLRRCRQLGMSIPDPTVLAKALDAATMKTIATSPDAQFRTQLLRTSLRLDAKPTISNVEDYQRHLQAEVEQMAIAMGAEAVAKVRATSTNSPATGSPSSATTTHHGKEGAADNQCRYFAKPTGCRRGDKCPYRHDLMVFPKDQRMKKCMACGAEGHRAKECPTKNPGRKGGGPKREEGGERQVLPSNPKAAELHVAPGTSSGATATLSTTATTTPPSSLPSTLPSEEPAGSTAAGEPVWTLDNLVQAAQQAIMAKTAGGMGDIQLKVLKVSKGTGENDVPVLATMGLADTGATHSLRRPHDQQEWLQGTPVNVLLAGGEQVLMRMNEAGTLLIGDPSDEDATSPIVPVGELVKTLGYKFEWGPASCHLVSPDGSIVRLSTKEGCPHLSEAKALELISRIERKKLDQFSQNVHATERRVQAMAAHLDKSWFDYLSEACAGQEGQEGKAVAMAPFFKGMPEESLHGLHARVENENGWELLKKLTFLNRRQRRRLWASNGWVIHMFAGKKKKDVYSWLNEGDRALLELDIERCQAHNLLGPDLWRVLSWAAMKGKIAAVFGGPPCRTFSRLRFREGGPSPVRTRQCPYGWPEQTVEEKMQVIRDSQLFARMIWLHAKATAGRLQSPGRRLATSAVAFLLEQPQDPQEYLPRTDPLWEQLPSFWSTEMWRSYSNEAGLIEVSFEQGAYGHKTPKPTTLGTNIMALALLRDAKMEGNQKPYKGPSDLLAEWAPGLNVAISLALREWLVTPTLNTMTVGQWKEHVARGHLPPRRDCLYCNMYGASGRPHRRVSHPELFSLSSDLTGPHELGMNHNARSPFYKQFKHLLVCKYRFPASFADGTWEETADDGEVDKEEDPFDIKGELEKELEHYSPTDEEDVEEKGKKGLGVESDGEKNPCQQSGGDAASGDEVQEQREGSAPPGNPQMEEGDTQPPASTYLLFATPLTTGTSAEILEALQDVLTYLRHHNLPVLRHHSDKASAFQGRLIRTYLKNQAIRMTTSEPGVPQSNGAIEQAVRWVKQRARTLLGASHLPKKLWPQAAAAATAMQRSQVLGFMTKMVSPFGTKVMIKKRHYDLDLKDKSKTKDSFGAKWEEGRYVGLSDYVQGGHLIYSEGRNAFIHTTNVRPGVHDPGPPEGILEAHPAPPPRRRLTRKTTLGFEDEPDGEARLHAVTTTTPHMASEERATACLFNWDLDEAIRILVDEARGSTLKFGLFRHGGVIGFHKQTSERPALTRLAAKVMVEVSPEAEFTSLYISSSDERRLHRDSQNHPFTKNYAVVLQTPTSGGKLWVELRDGDCVQGPIIAATNEKGTYYGCAYSMNERVTRMVDPFRRHWVMPWKGQRTVLVGYTVNTMGGVAGMTVEVLSDLGFVIPAVALASVKPAEPTGVAAICMPQHFEEESDDDQAMFEMNWKGVLEDWDMEFVQDVGGADENALWDIAIPLPSGPSSTTSPSPHQPGIMMIRLQASEPHWEEAFLKKVEVSYTKGIEEVLRSLAKPLAVVHNVAQAEVLPVLERWRGSIQKELDAVSHAIIKVVPGQEEYQEILSLPGLQVLPMKFVFTCKPPSEPPDKPDDPWYRRKARIVVCGNHAQDNENEVYTSGATAEVLRIAIALASRRGWKLGVIDVTAAFLRTPIKNEPGFPVVAGSPPKLLLRLGLIKPGEIWYFTHAFYGMKESPRLWSRFRDTEMNILTFVVGDVKYLLRQGKVEDTWWTIITEDGTIEGLVIIYVDDFLICAMLEVLKACAGAIETLWNTGGLQVIGRDQPVRFLGVEIEEVEGGYALGQKSYIEELLRLHHIPPTSLNLIPVPKDMANFEVEDDVVAEPQAVREAQQSAGELLWISQRTRPAIAFASSLVASLSTRDPARVATVAERTLGFLQRTKDWVLTFKADGTDLQGYADASFAPGGGKSHQGVTILLHGCPVLWKSGRQTTIALSTAESELGAELDGALALLSGAAMLEDIDMKDLAKQLWCDSTSAISISKGASSWRTRHLRIKALWLQERLEAEELTLGHIEGRPFNQGPDVD